jgi:hypothetical protein
MCDGLDWGERITLGTRSGEVTTGGDCCQRGILRIIRYIVLRH